jgi:fructokinase
MEAFYLGQLVVMLQAIMSPRRIILGGGVMKAAGLIERVQEEAVRLGNGYFVGDPRELVVQPGLGDNAGLLGAFALAEMVLDA